MKTKLSIVVAIIIMAFVAIAATPIKSGSPVCSKKVADTFSFLRTHRQGKGAAITWGFSSTNASGFTVQRTNEDPTDPYSVWIEVESCPCNSSRSYKASDVNPFVAGILHDQRAKSESEGHSEAHIAQIKHGRVDHHFWILQQRIESAAVSWPRARISSMSGR